MGSGLLTSRIGQRIFLPGHFDVPVVLEDARPLGSHRLVRIHNPVAELDHAEREIVAARFYEIPAEALQNAVVDNP